MFLLSKNPNLAGEQKKVKKSTIILGDNKINQEHPKEGNTCSTVTQRGSKYKVLYRKH